MEPQKIPDNHKVVSKKRNDHHPSPQNILQSHGNKNNTDLAQKQTCRSMEENTRPKQEKT